MGGDVIKNKYKIIDNYVIIYLNRKGKEYETFIDLDDLEKVSKIQYKWHAAWDKYMESHYARATIYIGMDEKMRSKSTSLLLHRYIMDAQKGDVIDHINHNTLDNRKLNLRLTNKSKNGKNRRGKNANNTSGYRNVSWIGWRNKWVVQLQIDGENMWLGEFDDVHEAGKFAIKMREKYYGKYKGAG